MSDYLFSLLVLVVLLIGIYLFKRVVLCKLANFVGRSKNGFGDAVLKAINGISWFFYFVIAFYFAVNFLFLDDNILFFVKAVFLIVLVYQLIQTIGVISEYFLAKFSYRRSSQEEVAKTTFLGINIILKILLWFVGIGLILSNLGVNITSLIASLGIGGIAVALAAQSILGDVFSSFIIYFDKPFEIGDYIVLGEDSGFVEKIGLKTTRIRTLQGEELVVSNQELTAGRIHNYKKMRRRRILFNFGVKYETPTVKLKKIPEIVSEVISGIDLLQLERVHFFEFGESSLNFEVVYFVDSPDFSVNMDKRQEINFALVEKFGSEGIDFAYPTQVIYSYSG